VSRVMHKYRKRGLTDDEWSNLIDYFTSPFVKVSLQSLKRASDERIPISGAQLDDGIGAKVVTLNNYLSSAHQQYRVVKDKSYGLGGSNAHIRMRVIDNR